LRPRTNANPITADVFGEFRPKISLFRKSKFAGLLATHLNYDGPPSPNSVRKPFYRRNIHGNRDLRQSVADSVFAKPARWTSQVLSRQQLMRASPKQGSGFTKMVKPARRRTAIRAALEQLFE
jgi:hypothetical protein